MGMEKKRRLVGVLALLSVCALAVLAPQRIFAQPQSSDGSEASSYDEPQDPGGDGGVNLPSDEVGVQDVPSVYCGNETTRGFESLASTEEWISIYDMPQHYDEATGFTYVVGQGNSFSFPIDGESYVLDGRGVAIIDYDGKNGSDVVIPAQLAGGDVLIVDFRYCTHSVTSIDVSSCGMLGYLRRSYSSSWHWASLDVSSCSHLKYLDCSSQYLTALDISRNASLVFLDCSYNYLTNKSPLERWLAVGGHYGSVGNQRTTSSGGSVVCPLSVDMQTSMSIAIPSTTDDGLSIPIIGGSVTSIDMGGAVAKTSVKSDGSFRVAVGLGASFETMGDDSWNNFKAFVDNSDAHYATLLGGNLDVVNITMSALITKPLFIDGSMHGYVEGYLTDAGPVVTASRGRIEIERIIQGQWQLAIAQIPVVIRFDYGVGVNAVGGLVLSPDTEQLAFSGTGINILYPHLALSAGIGVNRFVDVSVYGDIKNYTTIPAANSASTSGWLAGEAGLSAHALCFTYSLPLWSGRHDWTYSSGSRSVPSEDAQPLLGAIDSAERADDDFTLDQTLSQMPAEWLGSTVESMSEPSSDESDVSRSDTESALELEGDEEAVLETDEVLSPATSEQRTLQTSVFNNAKPQLVITDSGTRVQIWTSVVSDRTVGNNTAIVYSIFDKNSDTWSAPALVDDDGTADFDAVAAVSGDNVHIAWANANVDTFTSSSTLSQVAGACDIEYAVLDTQSGAISSADITSDAVADLSPAISVAEGEVYVAWVSNSNADVAGLSGTNTLSVAQKSGVHWTTRVLETQAKPLYAPAVGLLGDEMSAACLCDEDGDIGTSDDIKLLCGPVSGGSMSTVVSDLTSPSVSSFVHIEDTAVLTWCEDGQLSCFEDGASARELGTVPSSLFEVCSSGGDDYLVCSGPGKEEGQGALSVCPIDLTSVGSSSIQLTCEGSVTSFSVADDGGSIIAAYTRGQATIGSSTLAETTSLELAQVGTAHNLAISEAYYAPASIIPGASVPVKVTVKNGGLATENSLLISMLLPGSPIISHSFNPSIAPGESVTLTSYMTLPFTITPGMTYQVYARTSGIDADMSDNFFDLPVGYTDLGLSSSRQEDGSIVCSVVNGSSLSSPAVLDVCKAGETAVLASYSLGTMAGGDTASKTFDLSDLVTFGADGDVLTFSVRASGDTPEKYTQDNSTSVTLRGVAVGFGGSTCFETASSIAAAAYPDGCSSVVIANYESCADAVSIASIAGKYDAPILLTTASSLPDATSNTVSELLGAGDASKTIILAGGAASISQEIEYQLSSQGYAVQRIWGADRQGTALAAYQAGEGTWGDTAVVAYGDSYYDLLTIAPFIYGDEAPVFFTDGADCSLDAGSIAAMVAGGFDRIVLVGGTLSVPDSVRTQLAGAGYSGTFMRLNGENAYHTNQLAIQWMVNSEGYSYHDLAIATSTSHYDGVAGAALCGARRSVLVLATDTEENGMYCVDNVVGSHACISSTLGINFLGGVNAISPSLRTQTLVVLGWL